MSDARKTKENMINNLKAEEAKLEGSIAETQRQIEEEMSKREDDEEMLEGNGMDRKALLEMHEMLSKEIEELDKELACYTDNDPAAVQQKVEETKKLKSSAILWTDNIESMGSYITSLTGDRTATNKLMEDACGNEYISGEGLREL